MPSPPLNFAYELDDVGSATIIGSHGSPCRVTVATARPDDPRGHATMELHYSIPGVRGYARALYADDVARYATRDSDGFEDDYDTLARMAVDMIELPHPLACVRDAARARKFASYALREIDDAAV